MLRPTRWASSITRIISSGSKSDAWNFCVNSGHLQRDGKDDDCYIAVVDARCRYKAPVLYDDEVLVRTYLKNIRDKMIHFGYECDAQEPESCSQKAKPLTLWPTHR